MYKDVNKVFVKHTCVGSSETKTLAKCILKYICHGKDSKVAALDKFQKFRIDTPQGMEKR